MRTKVTRASKGSTGKPRRTRVLFWYEIAFLFIIAGLVFFGADFVRYVLGGSWAGIFDVKETASIMIEEPISKAEAGTGTNEGAGANSGSGAEAGAKQVYTMEGRLLVRNARSLIAYDVEGSKLSERGLGGKNTRILEYGEKYIIYEADLGIIALVGADNNLIREVRLDRELEDLKVSKERIFVKPKNKNSIIFLDNELGEVGTVDIKNREIVLMEANFDSSELLCYNTEIADNKLSSSLLIYNKHQKVIASLDLDGALMLSMHAGSSIFLLSDLAIMNYSKELKPIYEKPYDGEISLSVMDNSRLYFIMDKSMRAGGKEFVIYGSEGEDGYLTLKSNVEHIRLGKKYILLASMDKIAILDYNLKLKGEENIIGEIEEIDWIDEDHFYLRSFHKVSIYSIN